MIFELASLATFVIASIVVLIIPGPSVTVIVANSLKSGTRAGLLNIAGTQAGLVILLGLLALGLEAVTTTLAWMFDWLRLAGGAYLAWLGYKLLRSNGELTNLQAGRRPGGSFFWQGFIVVLSNPKVLLFFGAFLPQFVSPSGNAGLQTLILGLIFMLLATILDSLYAIGAGRVGSLLSRRNVRTAEVAGGSLMMGGGLWLALTKS